MTNDAKRAVMSPFFVALMVWNAAMAHSARNRWFAVGAALVFAAYAGWFARKAWEEKHRATDERGDRRSTDSFAVSDRSR
jgi:hypothetical protein